MVNWERLCPKVERFAGVEVVHVRLERGACQNDSWTSVGVRRAKCAHYFAVDARGIGSVDLFLQLLNIFVRSVVFRGFD